jgi:hypothetical protein
MTILDFYFWGYVEQIVCSVRTHNIQHLAQRTREAATSVTPDVLADCGRKCNTAYMFAEPPVEPTYTIFGLINIIL